MRGVVAWAQFAFSSALQNFRRNLVVSLAGVLTIGLILVLVGSILMLTHTVGYELDIQQKNASSVSIYIQDSASLRSITNLQAKFKSDPRVRTVTFINKDAVEEEQKLSDPTYSLSRSVLGYNPLPGHVDITTKKLSDLGKVNDVAKTTPLAENDAALKPTSYHRDVVGTLQTISTWIEGIGLALSLILLFISLVIIMNTIRTAVFTRRVEVEIMKLVGATDWFVRWPFILEGMISGLLASIAASALVWLLYSLLIGLLGGVLRIPFDHAYLILSMFMLAFAGTALGAFGSYLGIRRFLNV